MEILASNTISGKFSNVITNITNVLNKQLLDESAKKLGAQQRVRKLSISEVAIALIAYLGTQGNSSSEGFCIASFHAFFDEHFENCNVTPKGFHKAIDKEGFYLFMVDIVERLAAMKPSSYLPSMDDFFYVFTDALRIMDIVEVDGCELRVIPSCHEQFACKAKSKSKYKCVIPAAGIKIHFGYSPISCSPVFAVVTQATDSERAFVLTDNNHGGILYICDKGYIGEKLWADIHNRGNFFIMKGYKNMAAKILSAHDKYGNELTELKGSKVTCDLNPKLEKYQLVDCMVKTSKGSIVRVVRSFNTKKKEYVYFVTNIPQDKVCANLIAKAYRIRWQQEIFHKALKSFNGLKTINSHSKWIILAFFYASLASFLLKSIVGNYIAKKHKYAFELSILKVQMYVNNTISLLKGMLASSKHIIYDLLKEYSNRLGNRVLRSKPSKRDKEAGKDLPILVRSIIDDHKSGKGTFKGKEVSFS